ncbi:hypothetical protein M7I_1222 [Glarea lozoyensis 74030]|uniref:Uncharacterized protein n=1 Tax=Glarea lozoyensis (strain ATCC 74030 / MF5533) TaxID=1104152 RepID=H0EFE8_GLAL7|nr:hypothetical protein M7I_1222 [Glarea lozoyensis 74030]
MLRGDMEGPVGGIEDINVESLVRHLKAGQTYDGGISESSSHEAHAWSIIIVPSLVKDESEPDEYALS